MIDLIRRYVDLLARESIDVAAIIQGVGDVTADPCIPRLIELAPFSPKFRAATLGRYRDTGLPFVLTLWPVPEHCPALSALSAAFGRCKPVRSALTMPGRCIIDRAALSTHWKIAIIATVSKADSASGDQFVTSVALRRDSVLPKDGLADAGAAD